MPALDSAVSKPHPRNASLRRRLLPCLLGGALLLYLAAVVLGQAGMTASISSPEDGGWIVSGDSVQLEGTTSDPSDGPLTGPALVWSSDMAGVLGTGESQSVVLSVTGPHVITLSATNSQSETATVSVTTEVIDPPVMDVSIAEPSYDGALYYEGDEITFQGSASDSHFGSLTGSQLEWSSEPAILDATGATVVTSEIPSGTYVVLLLARDPAGRTTSSERLVAIVPDDPPQVTLGTPSDDESVFAGDLVHLAGYAIDAQEGMVLPGQLSWESSADGLLSTGASVETSDLSTGVHVVSLLATNSRGRVGEATVTVTVLERPWVEVTLSEPHNGATTLVGEAVVLTGSAIDRNLGALDGSALFWSSDLQGVLGSGNQTSVTTLTTGTHVIELLALGSAGNTGITTIEFVVEPEPLPFVSLIRPAYQARYFPGETVVFEGEALTPLELEPVSPERLHWELNGATLAETGPTVSVASLSIGTHVVTFSVDSVGSLPQTTTTTFHVVPTTELASLLAVERMIPGTDAAGPEVWTLSEAGSPLPAYITDAGLRFRMWNQSSRSLSVNLSTVSTALEFIDTWELTVGDGESQGTQKFTTSDDRLSVEAALPETFGEVQLAVRFRQYPNWETHAPVTDLLFRILDADSTSVVELDGISVEGRAPTIPEPEILQPEPGHSLSMGEIMLALGRAEDAVDGTLDPASLSWALNGTLPLGTGSQVSISNLKPGQYVLTLTAVNSAAALASTTHVFSIAGSQPIVQIFSPPDVTRVPPGEAISFEADGFDEMGTEYAPSDFVWTNDAEDEIGRANPLVLTDLQVGLHRITVSVTSDDGLTGSASIEVVIADPAEPDLQIMWPPEGHEFTLGDTIRLAGKAIDPVVGDYPDGGLLWTSDLAGPLGAGTPLSVEALDPGTHVVTLSVFDSSDTTYSATATIRVHPPIAAIAIDSPVDGGRYLVGDSIDMSFHFEPAEAPMLEEFAFRWHSNVDGLLGTDPTVVTTELSLGYHRVTVHALGESGRTYSAGLDLLVAAGPAVTGVWRVSIQGTVLPMDVLATDPLEAECQMVNTTQVVIELENDTDMDLTAVVRVNTEHPLPLVSVAVVESGDPTQIATYHLVTQQDLDNGAVSIPVFSVLTQPAVVLELDAAAPLPPATMAQLGFDIYASRSWEDLVRIDLRAPQELIVQDVRRLMSPGTLDGESIFSVDQLTIVQPAFSSDLGLLIQVSRASLPATSDVTDVLELSVPSQLASLVSSYQVHATTTADLLLSGSADLTPAESAVLAVELPDDHHELSISYLFDAGSGPAAEPWPMLAHGLIRSEKLIESLEGPEVLGRQPTTPQLFIVLPTDGSTYMSSLPIELSGGAVDQVDGVLPEGALEWSSNIAGTLTTGTGIDTGPLAVGIHEISLQTTNSGGTEATTSVRIFVRSPWATVSILSPPSHSVLPPSQPVTLSATAQLDGGQTPIQGLLVWRSSEDGLLGYGEQLTPLSASIVESLRSDGLHAVLAAFRRRRRQGSNGPTRAPACRRVGIPYGSAESLRDSAGVLLGSLCRVPHPVRAGISRFDTLMES